MGLFGNDNEQDARLDALENFVRALSEAVHQNQLDSIAVRVQLIKMEARLSDKVNADDVDPTIVALNEQIGVAREEAKRAADSAADSWATMQAGATEALATLRASAEDAAAHIEKKMAD